MPDAIESYQQEPGQKQDNGYLSDPSAEYESNAPVSEEPKRLGARRRADVQQDAPSQVPSEHSSSHRARSSGAADGELCAVGARRFLRARWFGRARWFARGKQTGRR
jgi:hypothetical protein